MSDLLTQLKNDILELLSFEKSLYTEDELIDLLIKRNSDYTKEDILNTIIDLEDKFQIYRSKKKRYGLLSTFNLHIGKVELKKQGYGYFKFEESSEEGLLPKLSKISFINEFTSRESEREVILYISLA
jgi:hypothetical protein